MRSIHCKKNLRGESLRGRDLAPDDSASGRILVLRCCMHRRHLDSQLSLDPALVQIGLQATLVSVQISINVLASALCKSEIKRLSVLSFGSLTQSSYPLQVGKLNSIGVAVSGWIDLSDGRCVDCSDPLPRPSVIVHTEKPTGTHTQCIFAERSVYDPTNGVPDLFGL